MTIPFFLSYAMSFANDNGTKTKSMIAEMPNAPMTTGIITIRTTTIPIARPACEADELSLDILSLTDEDEDEAVSFISETIFNVNAKVKIAAEITAKMIAIMNKILVFLVTLPIFVPLFFYTL